MRHIINKRKDIIMGWCSRAQGSENMTASPLSILILATDRIMNGFNKRGDANLSSALISLAQYAATVGTMKEVLQVENIISSSFRHLPFRLTSTSTDILLVVIVV